MSNEHTVSAAATDDDPQLSRADRRQRAQYSREFGVAMAAYAVTLVLVLFFVDETSDAAKFWVLLPLIPLVGAAIAVYRFIQRSDEYGRRLQLNAMALGFGAAMLSSLFFGLLGVAGVSTVATGWVVFAIGMATWFAAVTVQSLRDA